MSAIKRRDFLKYSALTGGAILTGCGERVENESVNINLNKSFEWKMTTSWPPNFPVLGEGANKLAVQIEKMSGGRLKIQVYGGGELIPALEGFEAVSLGAVEMNHAASYYWAGKIPASQFFTGIPFGMNTQQTNAWLFTGGGLELWQELYEPLNMIPLPAGNTGAQMGGWFNKEINSIEDFNGLKIRQPGLGGNVITRAGAAAILSPGGEIYTNLERGVIDATEWIGPFHDYLMGFHKIARYYYYPAWHEPTGVLELLINKDAWNELPDDLKQIVFEAAKSSNVIMLAEIESKNREYLEKIISEGKVKLQRFPDKVLEALRKYSIEVIDEIISRDEMSRKIYASYSSFQKKIAMWSEMEYSNYGASIA